MKVNSLLIVVLSLATDGSVAFLPNRLAALKPYSIGVSDVRVSVPLFSTPEGDVPLDTKAIIAAYEDWRRKFGKGDFNIRRYHNFENNYRVLTAANIKARDTAISEGKTPPQWLELNEYGDFDREEYKAMVEKGEKSSSETASGSGSVRRTEVIVPPRKSNTQSPNYSGISYGTQVVRKADQATSQSPQTSGSSDVGALYGPPSIKTDPTPNLNGAGTSFGTQVVRQDSKSTPTPQASRTGGINTLYGPPSSSTPPPSPSTSSPGTAGTQVILQYVNGVPRGTQVLSPPPTTNGDAGGISRPAWPSGIPAPRGTQVISRVSPTSSSVNGLYGPPSSSNVNGSSAPRGTQVVQKTSDRVTPRGSPGGSSIPPVNPWAPPPIVAERGTYVVQRGTPSSSSRPPRGNNVAPSEGSPMDDFMKTSSELVGRGTQVIRQGTQVIQEATKRTGEMMESSGGSNMIREFSDRISKSIFSLFGGKKSEEEDVRSVRGTVRIQGDDATKTDPGTTGKQTVLVDMGDLQQKIPSIFSFFGGSKTEEGTVASPTESPPSATAPPQEVPTTPGRPTLVIDRSYVSFPGDVTKLAELRRWWQNSDGTVVGFIYNSKNFNDGTKLTSSKLQRAACRPGNILRSGGEDYLLK